MKIKLTKEQLDLLELGDKVIAPSGDVYRYLPFWFKEESDNIHSVQNINDVSDDLIESFEKLGYGK